jgi:hypothetical protein
MFREIHTFSGPVLAPRLDKPQLDRILVSPLVHLAGELGALIGPNYIRQVAKTRALIQYAREVVTQDPVIGNDIDRFLREVIDNGQVRHFDRRPYSSEWLTESIDQT